MNNGADLYRISTFQCRTRLTSSLTMSKKTTHRTEYFTRFSWTLKPKYSGISIFRGNFILRELGYVSSVAIFFLKIIEKSIQGWGRVLLYSFSFIKKYLKENSKVKLRICLRMNGLTLRVITKSPIVLSIQLLLLPIQT